MTKTRTVKGAKPKVDPSGRNGRAPATTQAKPNEASRDAAATETKTRTKRRAQPNPSPSGRNDRLPPKHVRKPNQESREPVEEFQLTLRIREAIARSPDPNRDVITKRLEPSIPDDVRHHLFYVGLRERVGEEIRFQRTGGLTVNPRPRGPSKWSVMPIVNVAGVDKSLPSCGVEDLLKLAEQHQEIAAKNLARAREYQALADELDESGCQTLGEMWEKKGLAA